jgi:hypothetical protein
MKVIVAGSRELTDIRLVDQAIMDSKVHITELVSGGARGVDAMGEQWARLNDVPVKVFPANWNLHGKAAGPIRNRQMAEYADFLVCIWDGCSRGTKNMFETMRSLKKPYFVLEVEVEGMPA